MNQKEIKAIAEIIKHDWLNFERIKKVHSGEELVFYKGLKTAESHFKSKIFRLADYFEKEDKGLCACHNKFNKKQFLLDCGMEE
ncbi:hypothetical protein KKG81_00260 [bacterium]|nr:hypothetical protein [bacterium]